MNNLGETKSTVYTIEDGILVSTLKPIDKLRLSDVKENYEVRHTILKDHDRIPFLMDIRQLKDISIRAILGTANQKDVPNFPAAAMVVGSTMTRIIAKQAKRFSKIETRSFSKKEVAMAWLSGFK